MPCPTQRTHAIGLCLARNTAWRPEFSAKDALNSAFPDTERCYAPSKHTVRPCVAVLVDTAQAHHRATLHSQSPTPRGASRGRETNPVAPPYPHGPAEHAMPCGGSHCVHLAGLVHEMARGRRRRRGETAWRVVVGKTPRAEAAWGAQQPCPVSAREHSDAKVANRTGFRVGDELTRPFRHTRRVASPGM
jgi:hypothetical protein